MRVLRVLFQLMSEDVYDDMKQQQSGEEEQKIFFYRLKHHYFIHLLVLRTWHKHILTMRK